jgi:hypothetical protein
MRESRDAGLRDSLGSSLPKTSQSITSLLKQHTVMTEKGPAILLPSLQDPHRAAFDSDSDDDEGRKDRRSPIAQMLYVRWVANLRESRTSIPLPSTLSSTDDEVQLGYDGLFERRTRPLSLFVCYLLLAYPHALCIAGYLYAPRPPSFIVSLCKFTSHCTSSLSSLPFPLLSPFPSPLSLSLSARMVRRRRV